MIALLAAVTLAGCGNGGERLSKQAFLTKGKAICERTQERIANASEQTFTQEGSIPGAEQVQSFVDDSLVPAFKEELDGLEDLKEPKDDESLVKEIIKAGRDGIDELSTRGELILNRAENPLNRYENMAQNYGLTSCGDIPEQTQRALAGLRH